MCNLLFWRRLHFSATHQLANYWSDQTFSRYALSQRRGKTQYFAQIYTMSYRTILKSRADYSPGRVRVFQRAIIQLNIEIPFPARDGMLGMP